MVIGNQHPNRVVLVGFEIKVRGGGSQGAVGIEREQMVLTLRFSVAESKEIPTSNGSEDHFSGIGDVAALHQLTVLAG